MARRRIADMTHHQRTTHYNDQFRKQLYAEHLEEVRVAPTNQDIDKFRRDAYKEALRDAKASQ
jgi:hypothetical protein